MKPIQFVQTLLTDDQALIVTVALKAVIEDENYVLSDDEQTNYQRLAVFFANVAQTPSAFAPKGELARTVKKIVRQAKGPAQPRSSNESVTNGRKVRQARRKATQIARRSNRREFNEAYNAAVAQIEAERLEAEAVNAELLAKLQNEPTFDVIGAEGQVILAGIPASMIVKTEDGAEEFLDPPKIILPGE